MRTAAATHVGRVRALNEDAWLTTPALAVVADGMGGHACGDVASALAIAALAELGEAAELDPADVLAAIATANEQILAEAAADPAKEGMGTTLTGLARVTGERWLVFNVGDSRVYRVTGGAGSTENAAVQLTVDHSVVADLVATGQLAPRLARVHPLRSMITRSLGTEPAPDTDTWLFPVADDDLFVVCSDGLTGELDDWEIAALARPRPGRRPGDLQDAADALVTAAVERGGQDNVTVVLATT